jgi:hypothetical protein
MLQSLRLSMTAITCVCRVSAWVLPKADHPIAIVIGNNRFDFCAIRATDSLKVAAAATLA